MKADVKKMIGNLLHKDDYSLAEKQIGVWVTGKPLYRKVLTYPNMPNNTSVAYPHGISNIDVVVRYSCCWYDTTDAKCILTPRIDSFSIRLGCSVNKTNVYLEGIGTNWSTRTKNVVVIMEYTKTTD